MSELNWYDATLPGLGDVRVRWTFGDYREVGAGGALPHRYAIEIGTTPFLRMQVDSVTLDEDAVAAFVAAPPGFRSPIEVPPSGGDASARASVSNCS